MTEGAVVAGSRFDYAQVTAATADTLQGIAVRVRSLHEKHLDTAIRIGNDLLRAKGLLPHGRFSEWLGVEFQWSDRTARNYMSVAEHFGGKSETISVLDATTAYQLAAPSTPAAVRTRVIEQLEAGEQLKPGRRRKPNR